MTARATVLFGLGVAVIALHVVDDNFVQPQPGTSAGDHLVSGLVPLALLVLSAWAYPRLREGARATWRSWGPPGRPERHRGRVLLGPRRPGRRRLHRPAGRGRRPGPARRGRDDAVALALPPLAVSYIGSHVARAEVPEAHLVAAHEDVELHTSDGLKLEGWYVASKDRAAVIVFPGRAGSRKQARMLARHGYGLLLYDRRGEGRSQGDPNTWGWDFDTDIRAGIDFLKRRADVDPKHIGGLGLSVGGEMMLQTAAGTPELAAIVSEGAGARSMGEEVDDVDGLEKVTVALSYAVRDLSNSILQNRMPPREPQEPDARDRAHGGLLIHGGEDDAGHRNPDYDRAAKEPKQIWEAKGGHTDGIAEQPAEYERRVVGFFDGTLLR